MGPRAPGLPPVKSGPGPMHAVRGQLLIEPFVDQLIAVHCTANNVLPLCAGCNNQQTNRFDIATGARFVPNITHASVISLYVYIARNSSRFLCLNPM